MFMKNTYYLSNKIKQLNIYIMKQKYKLIYTMYVIVKM